MRALKKVPSNAKGLKKLPTPVRNKMGYMQDGAKFAPMSNQKISREMVEKDFNESMKKHMQFTNKLAKQLADGVDSRGLPLKPAARKALEKDVKKRKQYEQTAKPNYKDVGLSLPKGPAPFEDDAMPKAKYGMKAVKKKMPGGGKMPVYRKGGKVVKYKKGGELTVAERKAKAAAEALKRRELQDKYKIAEDRVTEDAKDRVKELNERNRKSFGKDLTKDQKARAMSRLRKNQRLESVVVRDNIKEDLRNIGLGKEELAYIGRPDRYGDLATIKDKQYRTKKRDDGSYLMSRVKNIYNDFEGQAPKGAQLRPIKKPKR